MEMRAKFDKYWSEYTLLFDFATILDSRCKLVFIKYCYEKFYENKETQLEEWLIYNSSWRCFLESIPKALILQLLLYHQPHHHTLADRVQELETANANLTIWRYVFYNSILSYSFYF